MKQIETQPDMFEEIEAKTETETETETCEHEYAQETLGRCYNGYTCKKCGYYYEVDSSD